MRMFLRLQLVEMDGEGGVNATTDAITNTGV